MHNVLRVWKRDVLRLFKAPAALVVVAFLVLLPSLYTWFNVLGFWNPYENTGNLRVCVVNEDKGAQSSLMGSLELGQRITDELQNNNQLGWVFTDRQSAMDEVQSGRAYAAIVMPAEFSEDFTTLFSAEPRQPQLEYYVNEKMGAVSPKITDTGASTLEQTINSQFVSTASSVIASTIDESLKSTEKNIDTSKSSIADQFTRARLSAAQARSALGGLNQASVDALGKTQQAKDKLGEAREGVQVLSGLLADAQNATVYTQEKLSLYTTQLTAALDKSSLSASQAAAKSNDSIAKASASVVSAQGDVNAAIASGRGAVKQGETIVAQLKILADGIPDSDPNKALVLQVISDLETQNANMGSALDGMEQVSSDTSSAATSIAQASNSVNSAVQGSLSSAGDYRNLLTTSTLPAVNTGLSQIGGTAGSLSVAVSNQMLLIDQSSLALDQLSGTLQTTSTALTQTDALLAGLDSSLETASTDLVSIGSSDAITKLFKGGTLDANKVASFMLSPTQVKTENLYSLNAYGSAMAPLFTNLTLWIGVFMLMVILKQEVDSEGIPNLTSGQSYFARWLFLAPLVAMQAIVCCVGNLIIGVESQSVVLYILTAILASLAYLSIQFALSVTMQHIGKGICIILVFIQIPGATGLYPIEMTPAFFQMTYPFFPFTYGISAMRETIAGFYGNQWMFCMLALAAYLVAFFILGWRIRPLFTNLNRMFARQIRESDILNSEEVQIPARRYRTTQLLRALYDKQEYRERMDASVHRFLAWYPRLRMTAWVAGLAVPVALTLALSLLGVDKVIMLTAWLAWLVIVLLFVVALEHIRNNLERQTLLSDMSEDELVAIAQRGKEDNLALKQEPAPAEGDVQ